MWPQSSSFQAPRNIEMQNLRSHPRPSESPIPGVGPSILVFMMHFQVWEPWFSEDLLSCFSNWNVHVNQLKILVKNADSGSGRQE